MLTFIEAPGTTWQLACLNDLQHSYVWPVEGGWRGRGLIDGPVSPVRESREAAALDPSVSKIGRTC